MSAFKPSSDLSAVLKELGLAWGKSAVNRAAGELGPDPAIDFTDIENFADLVAANLIQGVVTALFEQKAKALTESTCPDCGKKGSVDRCKRSLTLASGHVVTFDEPISHCPQCRRDFFPPQDRLATR